MKEEFKQLIRLGDADLEGNKSVYLALRKIKGISYSFANVICNLAKIDKSTKIGNLSDEQIKLLEDIMRNPAKYNIKTWLFNRRRDYDSGQDKHLIAADLKLTKDFDIRRLKAMKCYRGMRHAYGLPVRGQRTRSNFRRGTAIGVKKKSGKKKGRI
jgi:small subunit ribosomal protein S13